MQSHEIPGWLLQEEGYEPPSDRDSFQQRTGRSLLTALSRMKHGNDRKKEDDTAPALKTAGAVFVIVLISLSRSMAFLWILLTLLLVRLAFMSGAQIRQILKQSGGAMAVSALILLPAALLGNWQTLVSITGRLFLTVTLLGILAQTTPWNRMTSGLQQFHLPDLVIFTLDTTMKYIILLGEMCYTMLQALRMRTIGKSKNGSGSYFAILGIAFLKAQESSAEMVKAMECRGFDGHFVIRKQKTNRLHNLLLTLLIAGIFVCFLYFQRLSR